jgi:uncharacterized protein YjbI with pentapeptide repeats
MTITKKEVLDNLETVKSFINEIESKKEEKVVGIAIKNRWTGEIIFQSSKTTFKEAVAERLLSGSNLSGSNLSGRNLRGSDLSGSDLSGSDLSDSNLSDSNLSDSNLSDSNLRGSDLSGSDLSGSDLSDAELQNAKFYGRGGTKELTKAQLPDFLGALGFIIKD